MGDGLVDIEADGGTGRDLGHVSAGVGAAVAADLGVVEVEDGGVVVMEVPLTDELPFGLNCSVQDEAAESIWRG